MVYFEKKVLTSGTKWHAVPVSVDAGSYPGAEHLVPVVTAVSRRGATGGTGGGIDTTVNVWRRAAIAT